MIKFLIVRDTIIEGHEVQTHFCKNSQGREMFVLCGGDAAFRFNSVVDAANELHRIALEKGWLESNMKVIEVDTDVTMEVPL